MEHAVSPKKKRNDAGLIVGVVTLGIIAVLVAFVVIPQPGDPPQPDTLPYWPTEGWQTRPPEAQGIDSSRLAEAMLSWQEQGIPIHSLMLIRNGYVVADSTFYPYDGQSAHDVASVTKSVMSILIGIAVDQGKLSLDDTMVSFFPNRPIANLDARKEAITVRHLVGMTSGLECLIDGQENNTVIAMFASPDFAQFVLDRPMAAEPGSEFFYCNSAFHLLSPILQQATGMTALEFAQQNLFEPLGIEDTPWPTDPQGHNIGFGAISLHPQDMARLGLLFLQKGQWEGEPIVSRAWVEESTKAQINAPDQAPNPFGYGWWADADMEGVYFAGGRLGQYILVYPQWDMILVTTGGGFEIEQIEESLLSIYNEMEDQLPANPDGVARLETAIAAVTQPPAAQPIPPLPDMARTISGRTYFFGPNPLGLASLAFEFDDAAAPTAGVPTARLGPAVDPSQPLPISIGLDGTYHFTTLLGDGRPVGIRGHWDGPQTFVLDYIGAASNEHTEFQLFFQGDEVEVTIHDKVNGTSRQFGGSLQEP